MNSSLIIGHLTRDPELRYSTNENRTAVCRITVAVDTGFGDKKKTSFVPVVAFGKIAENINKYLNKGSKVGVTGYLQSGSYVNKNGDTVYTLDLIANNIEFLGGGNKSEGEGISTASQSRDHIDGAAEGTGAAEYHESPDDVPEGFSYMNDDDIPF